MNFTKSFLVFAVANFIVLFLISQIPGSYLVFGNALNNPTTGVILTSIIIALVVSAVGYAGRIYKLNYPDNTWLVIYLVVNIVTLYILARSPISEVMAVGIQRFWVAIATGIVLNGVQFAASKTLLAGKTVSRTVKTS